MNKINFLKLKTDGEIDCVNRFIFQYNNLNKKNYQRIEKNLIENEIDVFVYDEKNNRLNIQVKKGDRVFVGDISTKEGVIVRDNKDFVSRIMESVDLAEKKYIKQNKDMSNVLLLLDEIGNPSEFFLNQIKNRITKSIFKEIWIVCRNNNAFKLF